MSFLNKRPIDGPTNRQDMLLDPEYVLSVFTTSDVISTYETIQADEDYALPGQPSKRQSVLPVHLLGLAPLLGCIGAVAGDVKFQDDRVMDHPVDGRGGGHGVGKDVLPLRENQV